MKTIELSNGLIITENAKDYILEIGTVMEPAENNEYFKSKWRFSIRWGKLHPESSLILYSFDSKEQAEENRRNLIKFLREV